MKTLQWKSYVRDGSAFHVARLESVVMHGNNGHGHADFSEIFVLESGEMDHRLNGKCTRLGAGALVCIRASDCHGFASIADRAFTKTNVAFPNEVIKDLRRRYPAEMAVCFPPVRALACVTQLDPVRSASVCTLFAAMRAAARTACTGLELEWFLLSVLREILAAQHAVAAAGAPLPDWLTHAMALIARPENSCQGTRQFAVLAGRSPEHVAREVHRHLGTTPTELVNRARLEQAAARLATTQEKILHIALDAGFNNLGHFYRQFQAHYHVTPRAYRLFHTATIPSARTR